MKHGQLSIDLLITLLVAITVISALTAAVHTYANTTDNSNAQQQLQSTAVKIASQITAAQALADTNYRIEIKLAKIAYTNEEKKNIYVYPSIQKTDDNKIIASIVINGQTQTAQSYYYNNETKILLPPEVQNGSVVMINE